MLKKNIVLIILLPIMVVSFLLILFLSLNKSNKNIINNSSKSDLNISENISIKEENKNIINKILQPYIGIVHINSFDKHNTPNPDELIKFYFKSLDKFNEKVDSDTLESFISSVLDIDKNIARASSYYNTSEQVYINPFEKNYEKSSFDIVDIINSDNICKYVFIYSENISSDDPYTVYYKYEVTVSKSDNSDAFTFVSGKNLETIYN